MSLWDYEGGEVHLVVDDSVNVYTMVLLFQTFLFIYKSTNESWISSKFVAPIEWSFRHTNIGSSHYIDVASAILEGKSYNEEMEVDGGCRKCL